MDARLKQFTRKHSDLFWSVPENKKEDISESVLIEHILNYGTLNDFNELVSIVGLFHLANLFRNHSGRRKLNYYPEIYNFFKLYFDRYAPANPNPRAD